MSTKIFVAALFLTCSMGFAQKNDVATRRQVLENNYQKLEKTAKKIHKMDKQDELPPNEYFEQDFKNTMDPATGEINFVGLLKLRADLNSGKYEPKKSLSLLGQQKSEDGRSVINQPWVERGPFEIGGRTRAIMFDPNDATGKRVFAGAITGGMWVNNDITNPNSEWQPLSQFWSNTTVSCIVSDPNNSQIFYAGTGEVETSDGSGNGIWKSTDGGTTWTNIFTVPTTYLGTSRRGIFYVTDIKVRNNNGVSEIYAGVNGANVGIGFNDGFAGVYEAGLYKSTDGGANFTKNPNLIAGTASGVSVGYSIQQIEIAQDNSIWVATRNSRFGAGVVSGGRIFRSTDGDNYTSLYNSGNTTGRVNIGLSATNPLKAYAVMQGVGNEAVRITKTIDGGLTWVATNDATPTITLPNDADTGIPDNDYTRGQSFYDLNIVVDPTNDDNVYTGGIDLFRSTNGAATWTQISKWSNNNFLAQLPVSNVHADQHEIVFNPQNPAQMMFGNDGGIYYVADKANITSTTGFRLANKRYNATQFYRGSLNPQATPANEEFLVGAQDNGTQMLAGAPLANNFYGTSTFYGGDGAYTEYDDLGKYIIASYVYNNHFINSIPNNSFTNIFPSAADRGLGHFINEMTVDRNLDIFYSYRVGLTINRVSGLSTSPLSLVRSQIVAGTPATGEQVSALKVSPFNTTSSTLFVGSNLGKLYKITGAETASPVSTPIVTPFVGTISDIGFGSAENEIAVTISNYGPSTINVFYSNDGGATWNNKEGNLPDMPIRTILVNPEKISEAIVGTELGVWGTANFTDATPTWAQYSGDMGNVRVTDLDYRPSTKTILAATYGRGAWTTTNSTELATSESGSRNLARVYPNPSRGPLHVKFDSAKFKNADISIFDASGKLIFTKAKVSSDEEFMVNFPKGVYVLKAESGGTVVLNSSLIIK